MGKNAATVFRDRTTGRKRDLNAEKQASDAKKAAWEQKYKEWNKGFVFLCITFVTFYLAAWC